MTRESSMKGEGGRGKINMISLKAWKRTWRAEPREITDYDVR